MNFLEKFKEEFAREWDSLKEHSFLRDLAKGTLPKKCFFYYLSQDDYYLEDLLSAIGMLVVKADEKSLRRFAIKLLKETVDGELAMHELLEKHNEFSKSPKGKVALWYGNFLINIAFRKSTFVIIASMLPCFVSYLEIGTHYLNKTSPNMPSLYRAWLESYAGEDYRKLVEELCCWFEKEAQKAPDREKQEAKSVFKQAIELEWLFWEESYNCGKLTLGM
ncbi:MAG: hypothetical protein J7J32_06405 [Candidatus Atribacteria bacterium]|nr:hypothetical protein [Candidatus Atribacteria bacterium]MCD6350417.1 hypothetical protein [Candidatus Atribacteria bacterium]